MLIFDLFTSSEQRILSSIHLSILSILSSGGYGVFEERRILQWKALTGTEDVRTCGFSAGSGSKRGTCQVSSRRLHSSNRSGKAEGPEEGGDERLCSIC